MKVPPPHPFFRHTLMRSRFVGGREFETSRKLALNFFSRPQLSKTCSRKNLATNESMILKLSFRFFFL